MEEQRFFVRLKECLQIGWEVAFMDWKSLNLDASKFGVVTKKIQDSVAMRYHSILFACTINVSRCFYTYGLTSFHVKIPKMI